MKGVRMSQDLIDEYVGQGFWTTATMTDCFERNAELWPDKEAVVDSEKRLTWLQVKVNSDRLALKLLELGFKRDDIILVQLPNSVDAFIVQIACRKAGVVNAQALPVFRENEIRAVLEMVAAKGVIMVDKSKDFDNFAMIRKIQPQVPSLQHIFISGEDVPGGTMGLDNIFQETLEARYATDSLKASRIPSFDTSIILLTSGTTGMPKAVEWSEAACIVGGKGILEKTRANSEDIFGGLMPMAGASGYLSLWLAAPQIGAKTVFLKKWDAGSALELIEKEKMTILFCAPPQLEMLLQHPDFERTDFSSVRAIRSGAGPLLPDTAIEIEKKIGCRVAISSGTTEAGVLASSCVDDDDYVRLYTLGKAITGMELNVIDEQGKSLSPDEPGDLLVRGAAAGSGYFKNEKATLESWGSLRKDAWFSTGDIATLDKFGNLKIVGRKKDMILRGGQNIFPKLIEDILRNHPKVLDVAVIGMPDSIMGEKCCAYIVCKEDNVASFDEIISFLTEQKLSKYMLPERVEFINSIPTVTYTGKADKKLLREDITKKLKDEGKI